MVRLGRLAGPIFLLAGMSLGACDGSSEEAGESPSPGTSGHSNGGSGGTSGAGGVVLGGAGGSLAGAGGGLPAGSGGMPPGGSGQAGGSAGAGSVAGGAGESAAGGPGGEGGAEAGGTDAGGAGTGGSVSVVPETICEPWAEPVDKHDQSVVPVEVAPNNVGSKKVILIAGKKSDHPQGQHEFFAVTAALAKLICAQPGVVPVVVRDGWPQNESILDGAAAVVFYADGGDNHPLNDPGHRAKIQGLMDAGVGFANLHYAVEYPIALQPEVLPWLGGVYEPGYSANPLWRADVGALPAHPISQGVSPFSIDDEWYFGMRWITPEDGITPIVQATPPDDKRITPETASHPGRIETLAWAYERANGGRSFGFTGGHWYENWFDGPDTPDASKQRRIVVNAILWTAGVGVPAEGANVDLSPSDHGRWLDTK